MLQLCLKKLGQVRYLDFFRKLASSLFSGGPFTSKTVFLLKLPKSTPLMLGGMWNVNVNVDPGPIITYYCSSY